MSGIITLRIFLFVLAYLIFILLMLFVPQFSSTKMVVLFYGLIMMAYVFDISWLFQVQEKMQLVSVIRVLGSLLSFIMIFIFARGSVELAAFLLFLGAFIAMVGAFLLYKKGNHFKFFFDKNFFKFLIKEAAPVGMVLCTAMASFNLPVIMLGVFKSGFDIGLYSAAYKVLQLAVIPNTLWYQSCAPQLARDGFCFEKFKLYVYGNICIGGIIALIMFILAPLIINILYGHNYVESIPVLKVMSICVFVSSLVVAFASPLVLWGYQKYHMIARIVGIVLLLLSSFIIIPRYGIASAVFTSIIADSVVVVLAFIMVAKIWRQKQLFEK